MTIEQLREELREDNRRLESKLDEALREQSDMKVKVATNEASARAAHARVAKVERGVSWFSMGIIGACGLFIYDFITGKK